MAATEKRRVPVFGPIGERSKSMHIYLARQVIFDRKMQAAGYELLYRSGESNAYDPSVDGDVATRRLLSRALVGFGLEEITGGKPAFINFTENLLRQQAPFLADPGEIIVEVLEQVLPTPDILPIFQELREKGYRLAMDDYTGDPCYDAALPYMDIVKVDFAQVTSGAARAQIAQNLLRHGVECLAEKVETQEDFKQAEEAGYTYFQGYFFSRPLVMSKAASGLMSHSQLRVLQMLRSPDMDFDRLTDAIKTDLDLAYKVLYRVNTLGYYRGYRVANLRDALVRMGVRELQRWMLLLLIEESIPPEKMEIVRLSLVRAHFSEQLASRLKGTRSDEGAFFLGMFSLLDVFYNEDLESLLDKINISDEVKDALAGKKNLLGCVLDFVRAYETGDWEQAQAALQDRIPLAEASDFYLQAVAYGDAAFGQSLTVAQSKQT